jgi:hypothetical protein
MKFLKNLFKKNKKIRIGRLEYVNIPQLELYNVSAKIDTGAYHGAINAANIEEIEEDGVKKLKFQIVNKQNSEEDHKFFKTTEYSQKYFIPTKVDSHHRYVIPVKIEIVGVSVEAELSLTDRSNLRHDILIGRRALKNNFMIDVDKKY